MMKLIEVPEYVAKEFNAPLSHPSGKGSALELSILRVYRLINEALKDIDWPDWEVDNRRYHSKFSNEPYGFERMGGNLYIYVDERGQRNPVAIFHSDHMAAKYFVWLVSKGKVEINWELFLEMEG